MQSLQQSYSLRTGLHEPPAARMRGFTAIELMVVVAILGVLAALAAPSFTPIIERWRVNNASDVLVSTMYFARSEAIKRSGGITMEADNNDWSTGWVVRHNDGSNTVDLQQISAPDKVTIASSDISGTVFLDRWGMASDMVNGTAKAITFTVTPTGGNAANTTRVCVEGAGRIAKAHNNNSCP